MFGLAKYFDAQTGKDDGERVDRTVDYAGLERATDVKAGDVRSDIFFTGVVLFEMLTGKSPIELTRDRRARRRDRAEVTAGVADVGERRRCEHRGEYRRGCQRWEPSRRRRTCQTNHENLLMLPSGQGAAVARDGRELRSDPGGRHAVCHRWKRIGLATKRAGIPRACS